MTFEEMFAVINGEDPVKAREEAELRSRIHETSRQYIKAPVETWPYININWDVSLESQRFSLDGSSADDFKKYYPDGFLLGYVRLLEIDNVLHHFSWRHGSELWEVGSESKLAKMIVYLSEGRPISPPLVKPVENGEVILQGGHHRYAIAKAIGVKSIPIHTEPEYKSQIDGLLGVEWKND